MSQHSLVAVIGLSVAAVIAMVCGLTWIASAGEWLLPRILTLFMRTQVVIWHNRRSGLCH